MKKILFFTLALFSIGVFAQVSVSASHKGGFKDLSKQDYKEIKSRTTVFVVDDFVPKEFEKMISSFWNLNQYIVVSRGDFTAKKENYINDKYAIFEFSGEVVTVQGKSFSTDYLYLNYTYYYCTDIQEKRDKKGNLKYDTNEVASVFFGGDAKSMFAMIRNLKYDNLEDDLYNYKLGFMKNYLQMINDLLKANDYSFTYANDYNKNELKKLANATLYVPDYIKTKYNGWTGNETERENPDELFKKYKFKYEWMNTDKLNDKILNTSEEFFYLMYTKINSQKFVSVVNGRTGEIIYREYDTFSYTLKPGDVSQLNSKIK